MEGSDGPRDSQRRQGEGRWSCAFNRRRSTRPSCTTARPSRRGWSLPRGRPSYIGGQNGTDGEGALLDGLEAQTEQALRNVLAVLAEAGSRPENVAKLTIYLAPDIDPGAAYAATRSVWGDHRTAVTVVAVRRHDPARSSRSRPSPRSLNTDVPSGPIKTEPVTSCLVRGQFGTCGLFDDRRTLDLTR